MNLPMQQITYQLLVFFIGFIIGYFLGRRKVKLKVLYIPELFSDILRKAGMPKRLTTKEAREWLSKKLEKI